MINSQSTFLPILTLNSQETSLKKSWNIGYDKQIDES